MCLSAFPPHTEFLERLGDRRQDCERSIPATTGFLAVGVMGL